MFLMNNMTKIGINQNEYYELMSEQSDVNNDIRFLEHTIKENEAKNHA